MIPVVSSNDILGIDISISQNPIPCGGSATVTVTIRRASLNRGQLPLGGIVKLWDYDSSFRDGDDLLDQKEVILWFEENTLSFTLRCDSKDGGCDLYGPSGESGESSTDIFASFYNYKSARIHVKCEQIDTDGEISIHGSDDCIVGDEVNFTLSADKLIENVSSAQWGISYDPSVFEVSRVEIIHPALLIEELEGNLSYDITVAGVILFNLVETSLPIPLEGDLVNIALTAKNNSPIVWDTSYLRCKEDSAFYNEMHEKINVCLGGNHSVFIAPKDNTAPVINETLISFSQGKIVGSADSITDDLDGFENYLTVSLYNETNALVAEQFVNPNGSFQLDNFIWLDNKSPSTLTVYNGVGLSTSYSFIPSTTSVPYVMPDYQTYTQNNTAAPGETIQLRFEVLSKCDSTETYDFTVSDTKGWNIKQSTFERILKPMENKTITVNVTIPATAENKTVDKITLTMSSQTYPENRDSSSAFISVFGTYKAPAEKPSTETPGFEIILLIAAALVIYFLKEKHKR